LGELRVRDLSAVRAIPVGPGNRRLSKHFLGARYILLAQYPQFGLAFGGRQFAHCRGKHFAPDLRTNAIGLEEVLRVVDRDAVE
jgi:hypothetical protein